MEVHIMQRFTNPRDLFHGKGALEAAKFLTGRAPGLYDMKDVLQ